jgi:hypothetical protein
LQKSRSTSQILGKNDIKSNKKSVALTKNQKNAKKIRKRENCSENSWKKVLEKFRTYKNIYENCVT